MKCSRGGAGGPGAEEPMMSGKTLGEMLQRLHQAPMGWKTTNHVAMASSCMIFL
jgi:hypothetical protein